MGPLRGPPLISSGASASAVLPEIADADAPRMYGVIKASDGRRHEQGDRGGEELSIEDHGDFRNALGWRPCGIDVWLLANFVRVDLSCLTFELALHQPKEHERADLLPDHYLRSPWQGIESMPSLGFAVGGLDAPATLIEISNGACIVLGPRQRRDQEPGPAPGRAAAGMMR